MFKGSCINDFWAKGPDKYISNILGCYIRFRENYIAFIGDIKKMFNSVHIGTIDQHCHRFLWRALDESVDPDIYVITAVNFGDRPSGTIAAVALRKTAIMENERFPDASKVVLESTYVDDIIDSAEDIETVIKLTEDITTMLKKGNFHMKEWIYSYKNYNEDKEDKIIDVVTLFEDEHTEKVLGMKWLVQSDMFKFEISDKIIETFNKPAEVIPLRDKLCQSLTDYTILCV